MFLYGRSVNLVARPQIEENPLVRFLALDLTSPDSIETVLSHIDYVMQYGEDEEPKEVRFVERFRVIISVLTYTFIASSVHPTVPNRCRI